MKLLHTSDWHLGVSLEQAPRHEEHRRFLEWLLEQVTERDIDAIVVSGDIYHYMQPSAAAQADFYSFLARCASETSLSSVVLIAGNHDSPSRFDAPREILQALDVHVVGTISSDPADWERCIHPLRGPSGEVEVVCVAVPYVSESRLGVTTTDRGPREIREEYVARFTELYGTLARKAKQDYPGAACIAMGHLTCASTEGSILHGDFQTPIHQFGTIHGLPPSIFEEYQYAALGHIHRFHQVGDSHAWYSGSPVPTNVVESRTPRYVITIEAGGERTSPRVKPVRVPRWRDVYELVGSEDEILDLLSELTWESELAPYLYIERLVTTPTRSGVDRFQDFLAHRFEEPRPRIVGFKKTLVAEDDVHPVSQRRAESLDDMTPEDVFRKMYRLKHGQDAPESILVAFRSLLTSDEESAEVS